ncbi:MAG: hypothetical protein Crog4KO_30630 [Crocinitomicaceae bacterium]
MDVNEYITSGILEAYVLGGLSHKEQQEVECMSSIYEEIGTELDKLRSGFETVAKANAIEPPSGLKAAILETIKNTPQDHNEQDAVEDQAPIIEMKPATSKVQLWRVAAVIFVLLSAGLGFMYSSSLSEVDAKSNQFASLEKDFESQQTLLNQQMEEQAKLASLNAFLSNKETQQVVMPGTELDPEASTRVFYNPNENQVALQIDYLPEAPSDKQYQLWAIVDGQPTDMGVLDSSNSEDLKMVDYAYGSPQAFAITLEKTGGSAQPDLTNLYVIGSV